MIRQDIIVALRHALRNRLTTSINVFGLAVGMACSLLMLFFVYDELRYDRHHENADRIVRVTADYPTTGRHWACIGPPVGGAIANFTTDVENVVRFKTVDGSRVLFAIGEKRFVETNVIFADSALFDVFSVRMLEGDPTTALREPRSLVLARSVATKYFGAEPAIGKVLQMNGNVSLTVTGVIEDRPATTHLSYDAFISMSTFYSFVEGDYLEQAKTWAGFHTYLLLREGVRRSEVEKHLPNFVRSYFQGVWPAPPDSVLRLHLQPLTDIHLYSHLEKELGHNGDITFVYIFLTVAFVVLLAACINFANLVTAQFTKRIREVGVRKILGAEKSRLTAQFLVETSLLVVVSLFFAFLIMEALSPMFNSVTQKTLSYSNITIGHVITGFGFVVLLTSVVSGLGPSLLFARRLPIDALKGSRTTDRLSSPLRKGLIIFQFTISVFLLAGVLIIEEQLAYIRNKDLGFNKEQVMIASFGGGMYDAVHKDRRAFLQRIRSHASIVSAGLGSEAPGQRFSLESIVRTDKPGDNGVQMRVLWGVDDGYLPTLGIRIAEGRNFDGGRPADSTAFLLNRSAVRALELDRPIGRMVRWGNYAGPVVGIIEDFHFASLHRAVEPLFIPHRPKQADMLFARVAPGRFDEAIEEVGSDFEALVPGTVFQYAFLDEEFEKLYEGEVKLGRILRFFTGLSILISCLGLFGLSMFAAERRTKELGVRKVLGANDIALIGLLSRDFLALVITGTLIGIPAAWYVTSLWLETFAYRVETGPVSFIAASLIAIGTAFFTVSAYAWSVTRRNPVESLRYE